MRLPPVYPVLITVAVVLASFAEEAALVSELARPVLVMGVGVALFQIVATSILQDREQGAFAAAFAFTAVASPALAFGGLLPFLLFVTGPAALARARGRAPRPEPWAVGTNALTAIATLVVVTSLGSLLLAGRLDFPREVGVARSATAAPDAPDIVVILVDGHARSDTIHDLFSFDNEPFLTAMEEQGFVVARKSRSNYNRTSLTLATMFQMRQLQDIRETAPLIGQVTDQKMGYLLMSDVIRGGAAFEHLHELGYEIVGIPSEFSRLSIPADRSIDAGQLGYSMPASRARARSG